jgi:signal transduction histidine kinase
VVRQRLGPTPTAGATVPDTFIVLQDASGRRLAGNLSPVPPRSGLAAISQGTLMPDVQPPVGGVRLLGRGLSLTPDTYLFVARSTRALDAARGRLLRAFVWITVVAVAMALSGGLLASLRYIRRIDVMARTCAAIIDGRYSSRIPVRPDGDELDRLGGAINHMLERIETLLANLRQVSSDIAHDLRSPLARLRHGLERAQGSRTVEEYATGIVHAMEDADHMLAIFAALLRISQLESDASERVLGAVALSSGLHRLVDLYRPVAEDHAQALDATIATSIRVRGDAQLLTQLFANLIENSLRHTPRGTHVHVALAHAGEQVLATVGDNGPGIPPEERDKVLRRFYRLSSSRSTPGYGLGLTLVAAIAQFHGAELRLLDNAPGLRVELRLRPA